MQQGAMSWFRGKSKEPEPHTPESSSFGSDSGSLSSFEGSSNFAGAAGREDERAGGRGASGSLAELQVNLLLVALLANGSVLCANSQYDRIPKHFSCSAIPRSTDLRNMRRNTFRCSASLDMLKGHLRLLNYFVMSNCTVMFCAAGTPCMFMSGEILITSSLGKGIAGYLWPRIIQHT